MEPMTPKKKPMTVAELFNLVSMEFVLSAAVATFVLGGVWVSITGGIAVAQAAADKSVAKVERVEDAVAEIQTDVAVIKADQGSLTKTADALTGELGEQRKDIKTILRILGDKYPAVREEYQSQ
jgi:hypothetical protein